MELLNGLNKAQTEAVLAVEGPVMVMAGAGSGKTKVLTTRISYIIDELGIPPSAILAVTFTNKAANEMKTRIANMIDINTKYMWISTFHSFAARLLRLEINHLPPYTDRFTIIDEEDSLKIVKQIMKEEEIDEFKPKEIRNVISKSKNFTDFTINDPMLKDTFNIVNRLYERYLLDNNLLDFDDLIIKTIELFKKNPNVLEKYQNKFQYILVDEFQDTNTLQYNLMFMLSARYHNIFVVGDDFQSIYSFRGAKIENINRFKKDFREHKLILLEQNYRSTKEILDLANVVIEKNPNQIKKVMYSNDKTGAKPFYYNAQSSYDETMFVVDKIRDLVARGDDYSDIAILYRANYISRNFEDILIRYQIPYTMYGGLSFFQRKEIKDIIAYLRLMVNFNDDFSFRRIVNEPKRKIGPAMIEKLSTVAQENNVSLLNAIPIFNNKSQAGVQLTNFYNTIIELNEKIESVDLRDLVELIMKKTNYEDALKADEDSYSDRMENIKELKTVLKETDEFYSGTNEEKLQALLSDLALRTDNDDSKKDKGVILSTYHQVKGLEFKNVFMVAMEEEIFPSMNSVLDAEIEEERRICYVGITRAKDRLYITNSSTRFLFGFQRNLAPSRFIKDMGSVLFEKKKTIKVENKVKEEKKEERKTSDNIFKTGDKVSHKVFGDGVVVSVDGATIMVAFKVPYGIKTLFANHPAIRKI